MLNLFKKRERVKALGLKLDKIASIKLDLSIYPSQSPLGIINSRKNKKEVELQIKQQEQKLNEIYQILSAKIKLDNLECLESLSLGQFKLIMKQIDEVSHCAYSNIESFKKVKYLITIAEKIQQIIMRKALEDLNQASELRSKVSLIMINNVEALPLDKIEDMKNELVACLKYVDFSKNPDIKFRIKRMISDFNMILDLSKENQAKKYQFERITIFSHS